MSTDSRNQGHDAAEPRHTNVAFEERDVEARSIYGYLLALGLATAAALLILRLHPAFHLNFAASSQAPPPPSREAHQKELPPEPRLQGVPGHTTDRSRIGATS